jgi:hypothetical protein
LRRLQSLGAGLAAIALLAGCSSSGNGTGTYQRYFQALRQSAGGMFSRQSVTREQAASTPYASLGYRIDNGPEMMLVLATDTGGDLIWTSANHVVLETRDGRITRSVGLPHDLGALAPRSGDNLAAPSAALRQPFTSARMADFPDQSVYSALITCTTAAARPEATRILGQAISTIRVNENCESQELNWRFTDSYWLDPQSGLAWRSIQHVAPQGGTIEIEILRAPG